MTPPPALRITLPEVGLEREVVALAGDALESLLAGVQDQGWGLYLASRNAGTATSLHFWAEAMRTGVGLANPELFPWCLANAPCGALARRFGFNGPNATWMGGPEAVEAAHQAAQTALDRGLIPGAAVIVLDFAQPAAASGSTASADSPGRLLAWRLTRLAAEPTRPPSATR